MIEKIIAKELEESKIKHQNNFNSDWEAYAVILEEIQECEEELVKMKECLDVFWQRVRINDKNIDLGNLRQISVNLIQEASQVAAMCDKYKGKHIELTSVTDVIPMPIEASWKEYYIGEVFNLKGKKYICCEILSEQEEECCLDYCSFGDGHNCLEKLVCCKLDRKDEKNVYFEFINKEGDLNVKP